MRARGAQTWVACNPVAVQAAAAPGEGSNGATKRAILKNEVVHVHYCGRSY